MARKISLLVGPAQVIATLEEDRAPVLCERLLKVLPVEQSLSHVRFSGESAYTSLKGLGYEGLLENQCSHFSRGMLGLILWPDDGELTITYGQGQPRGYASKRPGYTTRWDAMNGYSAHFATVTSGDEEIFYTQLTNTLTQGRATIRIAQVE